MTEKEKWQKEGQTSPHPGLKTLCGDKKHWWWSREWQARGAFSTYSCSWATDALTGCTELEHTQLRAHPLWGPADSSLPGLEVCTSSRSGSNTGGTGGSLEQNGNTIRLFPMKSNLIIKMEDGWNGLVKKGFWLTLIYWESKELASKHLIHGPLWPVEKSKTRNQMSAYKWLHC